MPAQRTSALRRFGLIVFVFCLVCVLVIVFIALMFHRPESDDPHGITTHSSAKPTFPQIGYAGTATSTGRPASQWTAGVSAAWRIPQLNDDQHSSQVFGVHGDQLAVIDRTDSFEPVLSVYDISGAQPKLQWEKRGEHVYAIHGDTIAWWGDYIVTSDKVFDARTGEQLGDPLPAYGEFTVVGDILISHTYDGHCVGWRTPTETLWEETLGVDATLTTLSTSDGTDRWLLLRGAGQEKQWVLNASTGTTSQLMKSIPIVYTGERGPLIVAEDGWVAVEDVTRKATFMSANGTVVDTVTSTEKLFRAGQYPVLDGKRPTIAQLTAFARSGDVSWAEQSYSFTGKNCEYFRIGQRKALVPDGLFLSIGFEDDCHSYLGSVTTAADGSVAMTYQDDFNDRLVMFDMFTGKLLDTSTFGDLENSILAYDDLVLAKADQGILGLTPTH